MSDILHDDRRATEVIRRMRSLLKKAPFELKSLDLNDVVRETVEFLSSLAVGRKVELVSVITPDALPILGDRIQLQQVILNLVVNGIDAMKDTPSENRIISIRTSRVENFAELSVSDRGPGIPEDKLKAGLRTVFHQQGGRHGHGAVHRAHHYRGAQWADIGEKSGSRRRVVSDQASSCLSVGHPRNDEVDQTSAYLGAQFRIRSDWTALLPILWPANISTQKNKTAVVIATVAAISVTIVTLPYSQPAVACGGPVLPVDRG